MITAAMFSMVETAGLDVLVLTETIEEPEFLRSRLTRGEVHRQLRLMAATLAELPEAVPRSMAEIDWAGWRHLGRTLAAPGPEADAAAWFAARSLVPATLSWLRVFRRSAPAWFDYGSPPAPASLH